MNIADIKVGDRVRITDNYGSISKQGEPVYDPDDSASDEIGYREVRNYPGVEFTVTHTVEDADYVRREEYGGGFVTGDPEDWGIWAVYVEKVDPHADDAEEID